MKTVAYIQNPNKTFDRAYQCLAVVTALCFCFAFILLHTVRDDLSLWHTNLSIYAIGPAGWVLTLGFYAIATSQCLIAYRYYQVRRSTGGLITAGLLLLAAVGAVLVALFPYTMRLPHTIGAVMQLGLFPLSVLLRVILHRDGVLWFFSTVIALLCNL